jgi:GT2 family glycosyltransferase
VDKELMVTVGIPTKDRFDDLKKCMKSVIAQTSLPVEIIIIDDGNLTAGQMQDCRKITEPKVTCVYAKKDQPSLSASKNMIAQLAKGELVLIIDDDVVLENDYVENIIKVFTEDSESRIAAACGMILNLRKKSLLERIWRIMFLLDSGIPGDITSTMFESKITGIQDMCHVKWLSGCNAMFRKDILLKFPFEEFCGGRNALEDIEQALRIRGCGFELVAMPNAKVHHYLSLRGREFPSTTGFKHAYNRCIIFSKYGRKGFNRILFIWSFFGYIVGLISRGRFALAKGNIDGLYHYFMDCREGTRE